MKNLFQRAYLGRDIDFVAGDNQMRLVITSRELSHPFPTTEEGKASIRLLEFFPSLEAAARHYVTPGEPVGSNTGLWMFLRSFENPLAVLAGPRETVQLLCQYWKSVFADPQPVALYTLYEYYVRNENLLAINAVAIHERNGGGGKTVEDVTVPAMPYAQFSEIYHQTPATEALRGIPARQLPIEYLLMHYFSADSQLLAAKTKIGKITFSKIKNIVLTNVVSQLVGARPDFFHGTHQYYRLRPQGTPETDIVDPLEEIRTNPNLSWVFDSQFRPNNLEHIQSTYTLTQLRDFFTTYTKLFDFEYEEGFALDYLIKDDIAGLLEYDVQDELGNFFGTEHYVNKISGLVVSRIYQLYRRGQKDVLRRYRLAL